eukprot:6528747-Prymnesium_polylepis.1
MRQGPSGAVRRGLVGRCSPMRQGRAARLLDGGEVVARGARHADAARGEVHHLVSVGGDALVERRDALMRPVDALPPG